MKILKLKIIFVLLFMMGTLYVFSVNAHDEKSMGQGEMSGQNHQQKMDMTKQHMEAMKKDLSSKSGDEFDKMFLQMMISHHQDGVDMAKLANTKAKHAQIKEMSGKIINEQTRDIEQMRQWQKEWGY